MSPKHSLPDPGKDQAYIDVSALEGGCLGLPMQLIVAGSPEELKMCPSLAFFLRHSKSKAHLIFDLGVRRDISTLPPTTRLAIEKWTTIDVPQDVGESLLKGGFDPKDVQTVLLSHLHFDHIGDSASFPNATFILGGEAQSLLAGGYPGNPESDILSSSIPAERARFLSSSNFSVSIGPFERAMDYFGDGSLYIIDSIGHLPGHLNILARTSPDGSWIYLAGDSAHDRRLITGEKEIAFTMGPGGEVLCIHANKDKATEHLRRIGELSKLPKVQILLAHDWEWFGENKGGNSFFPGVIAPTL